MEGEDFPRSPAGLERPRQPADFDGVGRAAQNASPTEKTARIKRVRLEACHGAKTGDGAPFVDVPLPMRRTGARGPWGLILPGGVYYELPQAEQQAAFEAWHAVKVQIGKCVRVSIVEVEGSGPACIGELTPLRNCG